MIYRPRAFVLPFYMNNKYHVAPLPFFYVKKIIDEFKPDIINVCSPYPNSICAMIVAKKKAYRSLARSISSRRTSWLLSLIPSGTTRW